MTRVIPSQENLSGSVFTTNCVDTVLYINTDIATDLEVLLMLNIMFTINLIMWFPRPLGCWV